MKAIYFTATNRAELTEIEKPTLCDDGIIVKTEYSAISGGTEKANITANPNIYSNGKLTFPRCLGYSSSGVAVEIGKNVKGVREGDKIAMSWSRHAEYNFIPEQNFVVLPQGVSMKSAAFCHIGTFPMAAIRKTRLEMGESVLVMGLGVLGMLAVAFAKQAGGVPVIAADPIEERRKKALACGADFALDPFDKEFADKVKAITDGGVNVAIEVTGVGEGLNESLDCMKKFGRVALLGCTRDRNFTIDYYRKVHLPGITMIGAHTYARPSTESHAGWFTQRDDVKTQLEFMRYGRVNYDGFIDEIFSPINCGEVYTRLINDSEFPVFAAFDWKKI